MKYSDLLFIWMIPVLSHIEAKLFKKIHLDGITRKLHVQDLIGTHKSPPHFYEMDLEPNGERLKKYSSNEYQASSSHHSHLSQDSLEVDHVEQPQELLTHDLDTHKNQLEGYNLVKHQDFPTHDLNPHEDELEVDHLVHHQYLETYDLQFHNKKLEEYHPEQQQDFLRHNGPHEEILEGSNREEHKSSQTHDSHQNKHCLKSDSLLISMYERYQKKVYQHASKRDQDFWHEYREYFNQAKGHYTEFMHSMNDLLHSKKDIWTTGVVGLFEESKGDEIKQVLIFWFLRNLIYFYQVPFTTIQIVHEYLAILGLPVEKWQYVHNPDIWKQLDVYNWWKGIDPGRLPRVVSQYWSDHLDRTRNLYIAKIVTHIQSLDLESDLMHLVESQKRFPMTGVELSGEWSGQEKKDLFSFWISKRELYSNIHYDPILQNVLETQVVQTRLIQRNLKTCKEAPVYQTFTMHEPESTLRFYSKTILDYIGSIDSDKSVKVFLSTQPYINPYGMVLPHDATGQEKIKIIQFWTKYVAVFLKMNHFGETPKLQIEIGNLVKKHFTKMCEIMDQVLHQFDGCVFCERYPVCDQFLEVAGSLQGGYRIEAAYDAYRNFRLHRHCNNPNHFPLGTQDLKQ